LHAGHPGQRQGPARQEPASVARRRAARAARQPVPLRQSQPRDPRRGARRARVGGDAEAVSTEPTAPPLPASLQANPKLDDWIRIDTEGTITVRTGKVELGQGIKTAVAMIAAEELDVSLARIRVEAADSARLPVEFMTVG